MRKIQGKLLCAASMLTALLGSGSLAQTPVANLATVNVPLYQPQHHPFHSGEKAVYKASWNGMVSVATAEIYTVPTWVDGKKVYQVKVEARSSKALGLIWKMRDTITSTFDAKAFSPSHFTFHRRENSKIIDTEARYDDSTKKWAVSRQQVGKRARTYEFDSHNTLDPITAVYLARSVDFRVGDRLYFRIFGGRYQYLLELLVDGKEPVQLESGDIIESYRIIPRIQNITKSGYAGRLNDATIWISADQRRLPVKVTSKITFGSVYLELVEAKPGVQSSAGDPTQPAS